jgi:hypothetical protein
MLAWLRRLFGPPASPPPWRGAYLALEDRLDALERRDRLRADALKTLEGMVGQVRRRQKGLQEPPGDAIEEPDDPRVSPRVIAAPPVTEHLSRRFRLGG